MLNLIYFWRKNLEKKIELENQFKIKSFQDFDLFQKILADTVHRGVFA